MISHSLTHYSHSPSLTSSLTHSLTNLLARSLTHSLTHSLNKVAEGIVAFRVAGDIDKSLDTRVPSDRLDHSRI